LNPWRSGRVHGLGGISVGDDWDSDGVRDVVFGLDEGAMNVTALSGRTGREIWIFDTHGHRWGGGEVIFVDGKSDFTNDGIRDVVAAAAGADERHATNAIFLLNGRDGQVIWQTELQQPPRFVRLVGDYTGDRYRDLFVVDQTGAIFGIDGRRGRIVWDNQVDGDIRAAFELEDANGDGSQDLVVVTSMSGIALINGSNGVDIWRLPVGEPHYNIRNLTTGIGLGDVNGNGSPDIVVADAVQFVWCIDSDTRELAWNEPVIAGSETRCMARLDDYNHDGIDDFVLGTRDGLLWCVSGDGSCGLWNFYNQDAGHGIEMVSGVHDVDGNGYKDVLAGITNGEVICVAGNYVGDVNPNPDPDRAKDQPELPAEFALGKAYPNPFNGAVSLPVTLERPGSLKFIIYDINGRDVYSEDYMTMSAGRHTLTWNAQINGATAPSGAYIARIASGSRSLQTKIFHLK
jgi:hypothetical protein